MRKLLALILILAMLPVMASCEEVDPIVGAWCNYLIGDNYHSAILLFFYPDGVMWKHFINVQNDSVRSNSADMTLWKRDETNTIITDYRDKKLPVEFMTNDVIAIVDEANDNAIMYTRMPSPDSYLFDYAASRYDAYELEKGKPYVIGQDMPAGDYMAKYNCSFGRLFIYSSQEQYEKDISVSTTMIGSSANLVYDYSPHFSEGQVIKVNQPGCVFYHVER